MKLSIITINLNNAGGLRKTLGSVAAQTFGDYEHIIIDGSSTDSSVEVIEEYAREASEGQRTVIWVSEPDKGIYNAMNKGILRAKGEYCLFLNSGDYLVDGEVLGKVFNQNEYADILYGNYYTSEGILRSGCDEEEVTFFTFMDYTIHHSGCAFIKRTLFDVYGLYDENLKIASDWKWFLQSVGLGKSFVKKIDVVISIYDVNGISSLSKVLLKEERQEVIKDIVPPLMYRDYKRYYELLDSKLSQEKEIRNSWSYRIGAFLLRPIKKFRM